MNRTSFDNRPFCSEELLFRDLCWCWTNGTTIRRELYVIAWALTKPSSQPKQLPSPSFTFSFPSPRHMCPFLSSSRSGGQNSLGEFTINAMILSLLFWRSWEKKRPWIHITGMFLLVESIQICHCMKNFAIGLEYIFWGFHWISA